MKTLQPRIKIYYRDANEPRPRFGGVYFTARRRVTQIEQCIGVFTGAIQYKGKTVTVYKRAGLAESWSTSAETLNPPKGTANIVKEWKKQ